MFILRTRGCCSGYEVSIESWYVSNVTREDGIPKTDAPFLASLKNKVQFTNIRADEEDLYYTFSNVSDVSCSPIVTKWVTTSFVTICNDQEINLDVN